MKKTFVSLLAFGIVGGFALAFASAGDAASDVVKQREDAMKSLGGSMKKISAVAKGEAEYSPALNQEAANINEIAMKVAEVFPEGSGGEDTRAKPEIWSDWSGFEMKIKDFQDAASALVPAVESGERAQIGAALGAVGKTCGGCHDSFRKPKDS